MPSPRIDLYRVLGVTPDADMQTIRSGYRHRARRYHPDAGGDERRMMALNKAWGILRDPERRAAYDLEQRWPSASAFAQNGRTPPPPPPVGRAYGTVLDFGRYAGWSFGQLAVHDPDYLLVARADADRSPDGRRDPGDPHPGARTRPRRQSAACLAAAAIDAFSALTDPWPMMATRRGVA